MTIIKTAVKKSMNDIHIKNKANKEGYQFKGYVTCTKCSNEANAAYPDGLPHWVNFNRAMKFQKKGKPTLVACGCGHRELHKYVPKEKQVCKVRGCTSIITKADTDGVCFKCRKEIEGGGNPARWVKGCRHEPSKGCFHYMQLGKSACFNCTGYPKPENNDQVPTDKPVNETPQPSTNVGRPPVKTCACKDCNNVLPNDRKKYCYNCRPKHHGVVM